jgi:hypothetical protein
VFTKGFGEKLTSSTPFVLTSKSPRNMSMS